jgi:hypothetical protein
LLHRKSVCRKAAIISVFRVLGPYEDRMRIPLTSNSESGREIVSESYAELKKMGVLHASKLVNILNSGMLTADRIAKITKMTLKRQETAFGHLTRVAVWVQRYMLIFCEKRQVI